MEGFSGYPPWRRRYGVELSVNFDVETYSMPNPAGTMIIERPARHRIIIEGEIDRVAPYAEAIQRVLDSEPGMF